MEKTDEVEIDDLGADTPLPDELSAEGEADAPTENGDEAENEEEAATSEPGDDDTEEEGEEGADQKPKGRLQKRIDDLTRQRKDAERRAAEAESDRDQWRNQALRADQVQSPNDAEAPRESDFDDPDDYLIARARFEAKQEFRKEQAEASEQAQRERTQREYEAMAREYTARADDARSRYADFDEVTGREDVPVSGHMIEVIMASEKGPDIAYFLGSNPQEAARIAHMPPLAAAAEIGRIEAQLSAPAPKRETKAPKPVKPVGSGEKVSKDPSKMTFEEYKAWREGKKG